jgi:hypothetical protein
MLTANNPAAPKNIVRFNMKDKVFKLEPMVEQTVVHYSTDGWLLHKSSDEAKRQIDMERMEQEASARFQADVDRASHEHRDHGDVEPPDDSRQLRNQFNFSERAAQTINYALRERETFTEPPPTATASGARRGARGQRTEARRVHGRLSLPGLQHAPAAQFAGLHAKRVAARGSRASGPRPLNPAVPLAAAGTCTQWEIFDEYLKDLERQRLDEAAKAKGGKSKQAAAAAAAAQGGGQAGGAGKQQEVPTLQVRPVTPRAARQPPFAAAANAFRQP